MQTCRCISRSPQPCGPSALLADRIRARPASTALETLKRIRLPATAIRSEGNNAADEPKKDPEDEGLLPEEDWVVPGGYQDSLSKNTKLGRALDDACKELETLGELERESLEKANDLLKKLGYKGDITAPQPEAQEPPRDGQ